MSLNKVILMGRLTADPVVRYTTSNLPVTSFTLAVERNIKDKETGKREADFFDVVCWRNTAEFVGKYFAKGNQVVVSGSLQTRSWKDQQGNNRKTVEVVADEVYFSDKREKVSDEQAEKNFSNLTARAQEDDTDAFLELADDDSQLPFN